MGGIGNIRRRVLDGGGRVAVLPRYFIAPDLDAGRLVPLMPRVRPRSDSFRLVWRVGHPRESELIALAGELRAIPLR
jgi:DNA-binding transcriptional LysR family regulator